MSTLHERVEEAVNGIEAEMKQSGLWDVPDLTPGQRDFKAAFGMDTMAYAQWLKHIFLPRVREIVASKGRFPATSAVGAQAIREFDGDDKAAGLVQRLCSFDAMFR